VTEVLGINIAQGGAAALLAFFVLMIMRGAIVPRRTLDDVRADRDARIQEMVAERDTWRAAHADSEVARRVAQGQVGELLELSRTASHVLTSLPQPGQGVTAGGQLDQASMPPS
jgi:hypothetical protein